MQNLTYSSEGLQRNMQLISLPIPINVLKCAGETKIILKFQTLSSLQTFRASSIITVFMQGVD